MTLSSNRQNYQMRTLSIMLLLTLLFAAWHVASHEIDVSNDVNGHNECQVCRLSHTPIADLPMLTLAVPLLIVSLVLTFPKLKRPTQSYRYTLGARAPPLY